jgi:hypothetical protein
MRIKLGHSTPARAALKTALRQKRKLTQEQLAFASKIDVTYLGGIERGRRNPSLGAVRTKRTLMISARYPLHSLIELDRLARSVCDPHMIFGNAASLCGPFCAEAAAARALAGGSQHSTMRARSHRIAQSLSVSAPIGSAVGVEAHIARSSG